MAGLKLTLLPLGNLHLSEHSKTPRQLFFNMLILWLLVFLIAQPDECFLASSLLAEYTRRQCPLAQSWKSSYSVTCGTTLSLISQSICTRDICTGELLLRIVIEKSANTNVERKSIDVHPITYVNT
uniref:Uncharacterized protein n=1 Tax=Glossina pallidipes TaxID=7398 RepID=A0A1B0A4Y9_GLOPL